MTVHIDLGTSSGGRPAAMDLEELLATRLLVQGNSGCGKSHLLRRLLEKSAAWVQQAIIDPEGDYVSLSEKFGHLVIDAAEHSEQGLQLAGDRVRRHRVPVILNLEGVDIENQMRRAAAFLGGLFDAEREYWTPMLVVVDEAQLFAPSASGEVSDDARKVSLAAMTNLMCRGRKRGLAGVIATQRLAKLAKNVAAEASNFLMGRTFLDIDMQRAADLLGMERRQAEMFRDLQRGHFMALGPALCRRPQEVLVGEVETRSLGVSPKLMPLPEADARDLILTPPEPDELPARARRLPPPPPADILAQLAAARPAPILQPPPPTPEETRALRQEWEDIARVVMAEPDAAYRPVTALYQDMLLRCRIQGLGSKIPDPSAFRQILAMLRAGFGPGEEEREEWPAVQAQAAALPEETRSVYLLLARAALDGAPCPSDEAIAEAYGSRSLGRARRVLGFIEEQGAIVIRQDLTGRRIVTLMGTGRETAPAETASLV
ncbi:ATP-binding protein [Rhodovarius crocodyli]|uniref:ATP-binding protein n=1 Tax=Rhodovarius crocodyli TaxID=1979269 RepID=A0A437LYW4_9PROT|nr:ATP-binding protein [Rhodovarius crocodyli]RVT90619.1 ATP-binding protein [Rhodovarius crocodyli]